MTCLIADQLHIDIVHARARGASSSDARIAELDRATVTTLQIAAIIDHEEGRPTSQAAVARVPVCINVSTTTTTTTM